MTVSATSAAHKVPQVIDPKLMASAADGPVDAMVFFKPLENSTTKSAVNALAQVEAMPLGAERKTAAYQALHTIGTETLDAQRADLSSLVAAGQATAVDELWSFNAVRVRGASLEAIKSLAGPNVQAIVADSVVASPALPAAMDDAMTAAIELPTGKFNGATGAAEAKALDASAEVLMDWGVARMKAPEAWKQGITGAGITIGSLDTGVATEHDALRRNYRGTQADGTQNHDYNWKDVVKELPADGVLPDGSKFDESDAAANGTSKRSIDLNGHGTHTSGSAVGWSEKHLTGVAPDASLIVARGLGSAGGTMFDLLSAMEWFMAPTKVDGSDAKPELAPDIVTNSWGGPPMGNPFLWMGLRNWKRAGIIPVFAAGNARDAQPGQVAVPGMYPETITVGANDLDGSRAWFSMFGPSDFANDKKPEVMAPGHWTYSALPDGSVRDVFPVGDRLAPASGTSMATPHVAGAIALWMQANPGAKFEDVMNVLKKSGTQAGAPTEEMGYGMVQVDKLITADSISPDAKLTDKARVAELAAQVEKAEIANEDIRKPGKP